MMTNIYLLEKAMLREAAERRLFEKQHAPMQELHAGVTAESNAHSPRTLLRIGRLVVTWATS